MTDKKHKYVPFVTDVMTAHCPNLSEPDAKSEYADGNYKTEGRRLRKLYGAAPGGNPEDR